MNFVNFLVCLCVTVDFVRDSSRGLDVFLRLLCLVRVLCGVAFGFPTHPPGVLPFRHFCVFASGVSS